MKIIRLLSVETFRELQPINEDTDSTTLKKTIFNAQDTKIQELLGTSLYKKILTIVDDATISQPVNAKYKELVDDWIIKVLAYWAYVDAIPDMTHQMTDKGSQERNGNHSTVSNAAAIKSKIGKAENKAEFQSNLMVTFICRNAANFPEYGRIDDGIQASNKPFCSGGMQLDYFDHEIDPLNQP